MDDSKFQKLWEVHNKWIKGVVIDEIMGLDSSTLYLSKIPGIYNNYAIPTVESSSKLNLEEILNFLKIEAKKTPFTCLKSIKN